MSHTYECCPDDPPWPALLYTIDLGRASLYYTMLAVVPSALLTYLSTAVFFMSPDVGERLSCAAALGGGATWGSRYVGESRYAAELFERRRSASLVCSSLGGSFSCRAVRCRVVTSRSRYSLLRHGAVTLCYVTEPLLSLPHHSTASCSSVFLLVSYL